MSLDGWSNINNEPTVGISIVDTEGNYALTNSIDTSEFCHTAESLAEKEISSVETKFNVKVGSFVTDNAGNVTKMRRQLEKEEDIIQYECTAYILNLLSKDLQIPDVQTNVIKIIKYFRNSNLPLAWYKSAGAKKLSMPIEVRWNTIYNSISTYLKNRGILIQVCHEHRKQIDQTISKLVTDDDLATRAEEYNMRMHPIAIALDRALRDKTTISVALEIWHKLGVDFLNQPDEVKKEFLKRKNMAITSNHILANMLDYRFRGRHLTSKEKQQAFARLGELNESFLPILMSHHAESELFQKCFYADALRSTHPLTWWKCFNCGPNNQSFNCHDLKFEFLKLCAQLLSANATTSGLERIFSTFGLVHSKLRNRMGHAKATKLTFFYKYLNFKNSQMKTINIEWAYQENINEILEVPEAEASGSDGQESEPEVEVVENSGPANFTLNN